MTKEYGQGRGEPALWPDEAATLLVYSGRATNKNGGLNVDMNKLDSVGLAALQIHLARQPSTLSDAIEQVTGEPPVASSEILGDMARMALARHAALHLFTPEAVA